MKVCNCILGGTEACKQCGNNFEYNNRYYADTLTSDFIDATEKRTDDYIEDYRITTAVGSN